MWTRIVGRSIVRGSVRRSGGTTSYPETMMKLSSNMYATSNVQEGFKKQDDTNMPPRLKMKKLTKRAGRIMNALDRNEREEIERLRKEKGQVFDYFRSGDAVEVSIKDKGESRTQVYRGVVIAKRNKGLGTNFILINQIDDGETMELNIPLYAPSVKSIKLIQKAFIHKGKKRVRRSKLYYLRDRNPIEFTV